MLADTGDLDDAIPEHVVGGEVVKTATGVYYYAATPDKPGIWNYRFEGTGVCTAVDEDQVEIMRSGAKI